MSDSRRMQRVEKELRSLVGTYILTRFDDLPHKMVTVNRVLCSKDLQHAKVFVGVIGDNPLKPVLQSLNHGAREIQGYIGRELPIRYCPKLQFLADETTEQILKVETILSQLNPKETAADQDVSGLGDESTM
jgi:ribosome-binding factor A